MSQQIGESMNDLLEKNLVTKQCTGFLYRAH